MAETTETPVAPAVDPAATAPVPVAPPATTDTPAPPAAATAGPDAAAVQTQMAGPVAAEQAALQKAGQIAQESTAPPPPGPHARLLSMVQGLAVGLGAAGKAIGTHGEAGGVEDVQRFKQQKQEMDIRAQQARDAQKNQQIQQQLMVADTNHKLGQNIMLMATLPRELAESDLKIKSEQQALQSGQVQISDARRESMAKWGVDPLAPSTPAGQTQNMANASKIAQQLIDFASDKRVLGPEDPAVKTATDALAAAQKSGDVDATTMAIGGLRRAIDFHNQAVEAGTKQQAQADAAPFGAEKVTSLNDALLKRYQVSNPGAKELPPGLSLAANSGPQDFDRVDKIMQQTENALSTQATRDLANQIRKQTLDLIQGPSGIDPKLTGPEYISQLKAKDPGQAAELAGYASGRLEFPAASVRTAQGQALLQRILRAYPDFDPSNAPAYVKLRQNFTTGPVSVGLNSYNTSINHLGEMYDIVSKASPVDLNNPLSAARQRLDTDQAFISSELAKAVSNGQMTEGEKDQMESAINGKVLGVAGADKYKTQIQEAVRLMKGKMDAYDHQWQAGVPKGVEPFPTLSDDAKANIGRISGGTSGKAVSLKAAMALPINQGKTEDQVRADIAAHGHAVAP